ncbi:unnamed protein product [Linum tenue]|uniref:Uncharacterized protein n=1 Tax=Linum tenue TaxID=586396 RepID=A0AAV0QYJ8_9ROSI|nr:unnamed protein product [Linum tenue]
MSSLSSPGTPLLPW